MQYDLRDVGSNFSIAGEFVDACAVGNGHIHETFMATYRQGAQLRRYIHQRINNHVFRQPFPLMDNVRRITSHIREKLAGTDDAERRTLTLVPTIGGEFCHLDDKGDHWRTYVFIEGAQTFDRAQTPQHAREAGEAFGHFQGMLNDLPGSRLHETIPDFHNTPKRYAAFEEALKADSHGRAAAARPEIDFVLSHRALADVLLDLHKRGEIPERVTHNDTKFNNVMLDIETGKGICVIDLDTVMPGLALYDFGDMVRTTTSFSEEDERDLSRVHADMAMFEALVRGYLSSAGNFLNRAERHSLVASGKLITFEQGIRFLTDFLNGDAYYKIHRDRQNLDRCRTQFKLVQSIIDQQDAMTALVDRLA